MNPSSNYTNNEIITGIRNRARENKIITDSDEHVNNNINRVVENKTQLPNSNDFQYLVDSREQNNKINNQLQIVNSPNNVKDNSKELQENKISFNKEEYIKEISNVQNKAPKLKIELINSVLLQKGMIINIDAFGMIDSKRTPRDGFTYFGFVENNEPPEIDFLVKPKDDNYEPRYKGRHFQIRFDPTDLNYYIQDLGCGFGTFMKLTEEIAIKDNYLINLGNSYIVCIYGNDDLVQMDNMSSDISEKVLNVKVFSGNGNNVQSSFNPNIKSKIYIGRDPECDITIEDSLLSRIHCTIIYRETSGWVMRDGKYIDEETEGKQSTNGTWLYLMEESQIFDGMIFKGNQNLFSCSLSNHNNNI